MEKRSGLYAVEAESLVFELSLGLAANLAATPKEATRRAQWIPAWSAAALTWENVRTNGPTASSVIH